MSETNNETIGLKTIIVRLLREWKLFLAAFLFSFIPAILYLIYYPKTYEITARIQLQEDTEAKSAIPAGLGAAASMISTFGFGGSLGAINIDDELSTLSSNRVLSTTIEKLGMPFVYTLPSDPFFKLYTPPFTLRIDHATAQSLDEAFALTFDFNAQGVTIEIESLTIDPIELQYPTLPAQIALPFGTLYTDITRAEELTDGYTLNVTLSPPTWRADEIAEKLNIEEYSKTANVIDISYQDHERQRAKDLINGLIDNYNKQAKAHKADEARKQLTFCDSSLLSATQTLIEIDSKVEQYKRKNNITTPTIDLTLYSTQSAEIQKKLIELETQTHLVEMIEEYVSAPENQYNLIPQMDENEAITLYNESLLERTRIIENSDISNPMATSLTQKVTQLRQNVIITLQNQKKSINLSIAELKDKVITLDKRMHIFPAFERELSDLERQRLIYQGVYLTLLQKREEAALTASSSTKERAHILDAAYVKERPTGPRKLYALIGMMIITLLLPISYLFCKEQYLSISNEFQSKDQLA